MTSLMSRLRHLLHPGKAEPADIRELQQVFRKKYSNFRSLLTANNNALQAMADLEKLYYGDKSYRMAQVHSKVTTILVNVYKMIRNLLIISGGKYAELDRIFTKINRELENIIDRKPQVPDGPRVLDLQGISREDRELVGDKMANLGEAGRITGIRIPSGFVVTASATRSFLKPGIIAEINRQLQILNLEDLETLYEGCENLQNLVMGTSLPTDLEELLLVHFNRLEKQLASPCTFALRSSALGEDSAGISFAGLYRTVLHVDKTRFISAYKEVVASKYGSRAIAYRRQRGFRHEDIEMCVGCLVMVNPVVSGVLYSQDPTSDQSDLIRINAVIGLGKGVVDGTRQTETYLVCRNKLQPVDTPQSGNTTKSKTVKAKLTRDQLTHLAKTALRLEHHFKSPQDIEWAIDDQGEVFILQCRPLQLAPEKNETSKNHGLPHAAKIVKPLISGGITAARGACAAPVHFIKSKEDIPGFPRDAILVVQYPLPDWAPLLNRAAGIIAEHGSEAGHLATVSREFGIPALFSVGEATTLLNNGQTVTLDADNRAIFQGRQDDILLSRPVARHPMAGSPVQRILTEILQLITPLNLDNPNSPRFKPAWCETLHDITRFCHEKSLSEMFNFGPRNNFSQAGAKRLIGDVPLEWWVIDLADGLHPGITADCKAIRIEDVVSLPMHAIWQGISAYPWQGPPPVSIRGFGSIIFQSAMRPELDPAVASRLTTKNYFLISANFCNLSVRLGYHFAMIEAYLGDLLTENYVTFRFKGGAADMRRKAVRAKLLAEILKGYGFRVELRSDALLARIKKQPSEYLEDRLRILGYLTLHARQLDMVMSQPSTVAMYKEKFRNEIEELRSKYKTLKEENHDRQNEYTARR